MTLPQTPRGIASSLAATALAVQPSEVLLTISGASRDLLREAPKERTKQVSLGAVVLSTAAVAAVSATYAFHAALRMPLVLALVGGAGWGLVILNLDRWLVVSTPRLRSRWGVVAMAAPRVLLAVLIGTVISTPLTLAVFSAEIGTELQVMAAEQEDAFTQRLAADSRYQQLPAQHQRIADLQDALATGLRADAVQKDPRVAALQDQLDAVGARYADAEHQVVCEKEGSCGSGAAGAGIAFAEKSAIRDQLAAERDTLSRQLTTTTAQVTTQLQREEVRKEADERQQLAALQEQVARAEHQREADTAAHRAAVSHGGGILARLEALGRVQHGHPELALAHLLLFALVTALECMPVIVKTMLALAPPSLYDRVVALEEERAEARTRLRMQTEYEEAEALARAALAAAEARAARTLEAESRATAMVLDAQLAVTRESVRQWRKGQLEDLDRSSGAAPAGRLDLSDVLDLSDLDHPWPDTPRPQIPAVDVEAGPSRHRSTADGT